MVGAMGGVLLLGSQKDLLPLGRDPQHARHIPFVSLRQGKAGVGVLMEKLNNTENAKPSGEKQRV